MKSRGRYTQTPTVGEAASDWELPEGWTSVELRDHVYIAGRIGWRGLKRSEYTETGPLFLAVKNILPSGEVDFTQTDHLSKVRYDESPEIQLQPGDILLTKDGTIGKVGMVNELPSEVTLNSSILVVRPNDALLTNRYLFHFLRGPQFQEIARERIAGSAVPHLFQKDIKELSALVPPLNEQCRIVAKLEAVLERVHATGDRLAKVPQILKRFRQAVLAAACSGRLTEDWRRGRNLQGTASKLLASIASRRKARMNELGLGAYKEPLQQVSSQVPDVPEEWALATLDQLTCLVTSGSRGWAKYYSDSGPLFIRAQDISTDSLMLDGAAHVKPPANAEGRRTRVELGDLLVTITGANVTKSAIVSIDPGEAYVSQHIALVRPTEPEVGRFLYLWTISPQHGRAKLLDDAYGAGKPGLNLDNIREMVAAIPPLEEQHEIVRRVEALFQLADATQKRVAAAMLRAEKLTQAILAKAFRGELVPTEAELARREGRDYEPASILLGRLSQARRKGDARGTALGQSAQHAGRSRAGDHGAS